MSAKIHSQDLNFNFSELYITNWCGVCHISLKKLTDAGLKFNVICLDDEDHMKIAFNVWQNRLGFNPNSLPQFWYDGEYVGGSVNIEKFLKERNVT